MKHYISAAGLLGAVKSSSMLWRWKTAEIICAVLDIEYQQFHLYLWGIDCELALI